MKRPPPDPTLQEERRIAAEVDRLLSLLPPAPRYEAVRREWSEFRRIYPGLAPRRRGRPPSKPEDSHGRVH
jgi:hypothetical protein